MLVPFLAGATMGVLITVLGAGGSLFIVPVLVLVLDQPVPVATGTSLAVVFAASVVGAFGHWREGRMLPRVAAPFGFAAMAGAAGGANLHDLVSDRVALVLFALALFVASERMVAGNMPVDGTDGNIPLWRALPLGLLLGAVTGFLGVGGGFLIVPTLVYGARLSVRVAVGTSLAIIALSSAAGVASYAVKGLVSPALIAPLGGGAIVGALAGSRLSGRIPERPLRLSFGALAALVGLYVLGQSLFAR